MAVGSIDEEGELKLEEECSELGISIWVHSNIGELGGLHLMHGFSQWHAGESLVRMGRGRGEARPSSLALGSQNGRRRER